MAWLPGDEESVVVDSPLGSRTLRLLPRFVDPAAQAPAGALVAPMPGTVTAPAAGTVTRVAAAVGQQVEQGLTLAVVSDDAATADDDTEERHEG